MARLRRLVGGLDALFRRRRAEQELDEELRAYLESAIDEKMRAGLSREHATRAARVEVGSMEAVKDRVRDVGWESRAEGFLQDLRYAFRTLCRAPGFAAAAVLTLALGVGANTAIFSVAYPLFLKPLPYHNSAELVAVSTYMPELQARFPSLPVRATDFDEFRRSNRVFSDMSAIAPADFTLTGVPAPERLYGARVSANLFTLLGVQPQGGRTFVPEEDIEGRDQVAIISHELWVRRFGSDPAVLNRSLSLNGQSYVVVGIMPPGFLFPTGTQLHPLVPLGPRVDIWKPMGFTRSELTSEGSWNWGVIARLKPDTPIAVAQEDMNRITAGIVSRVTTQIPGAGFDLRAQLQPIREMFSGKVRQPMIVLVTAVALLLLIACVNVANLLLARISSREREFATRRALGASRWRLTRQLLTESLTIATLGGAAGLLLATWAAPLLVALGPPDLVGFHAGKLDTAVFLFSLAAAVATGLAFGLIPAVQALNDNLADPLKSGARNIVSGSRTGPLRRALVAVEVALCTALLAVAGLLLHSLVNVMNVDTGFRVEQVLSAGVVLSAREYPTPRVPAFYQDLLEGVRFLPGVASAGAVSALPLMRESDTTQVHLGSDTQYRLTERPVAAYRNVTTGYFATMDIALLAGRFFHVQEPTPAAVVSASLARGLWPDEPYTALLGRRIRQGDIKSPLLTIVGVVADIRNTALDRDPFPVIYRPHAQAPSRDMTVVIRAAQSPAGLAPLIRAEVWKLDANLPAPTIRTMTEIVSASLARRRFQTILIVLFGILALALAIVGIYGVTNYAVARQTQEIGIRLALGARRSDILRTVVIRGMQPVVIGLAAGVLGAGIAATAVRSVLFGVELIDPLAFGGGCALLVSTAVLASYVPARRAARVDPVVALRAE